MLLSKQTRTAVSVSPFTFAETRSMNHETDYQATFAVPAEPNRLGTTTIEQVRPRLARNCKVALFDFDGTLSLIREGWPEVMIPMMVEFLLETDPDETEAELTELVREFVFRLTGKQTIYQMMQLAEELQTRGGTPRDPQWYKDEYHRRLLARIEQRREALRSGMDAPQNWLVPFSLSLLENLQRRGIRMYLASGTDEVYVKEEASLLGLDRFFEERIFGAVADYRSFSKEAVIRQLLVDHVSDPAELIGFGDGYVEIDNLVQAGGLAVGVASDEQKRDGSIDPWKRERVISVGANYVIPDFRDQAYLLEHLLDEATS